MELFEVYNTVVMLGIWDQNVCGDGGPYSTVKVWGRPWCSYRRTLPNIQDQIQAYSTEVKVIITIFIALCAYRYTFTRTWISIERDKEKEREGERERESL